MYSNNGESSDNFTASEWEMILSKVSILFRNIKELSRRIERLKKDEEFIDKEKEEIKNTILKIQNHFEKIEFYSNYRNFSDETLPPLVPPPIKKHFGFGEKMSAKRKGKQRQL